MLDQLDDLDQNIVRLLQIDARMTIHSIAQELGKRRATIHARLTRLQEKDIIMGFTTILNFKKLGYGTTVFILVSTTIDQSKGDSFISLEQVLSQKIRKIPYVTEIYQISGEYDLLLKARVPDLEIAGREIVFELKKIKGINRTLTMTTFFAELEELGRRTSEN